ncbi:MAG: hypothetical protein GY820_09650, partial [Gammaproteobacteria bacterium]|nr:hypothetical protein [Gammaproteobacteria bacterium]
MGDRIEALNLQLSEERKKIQREREMVRTQETALERSIQTLRDQLQGAEREICERGTTNPINGKVRDNAVEISQQTVTNVQEKGDLQRQTAKRIRDLETRERELSDQLQAERLQSRDRESQQEEVIIYLQDRVNQMEGQVRERSTMSLANERVSDTAVECTSVTLADIPPKSVRAGRPTGNILHRTHSLNARRTQDLSELGTY